jgi:hypothetical protein
MLMIENYADLILLDMEKDIQKARKTTLARVIKMNVPFQCRTMEGLVEAKGGDYLAIGVKDEVYPIDADIFTASYEIMPDEPSPAGNRAAHCGIAVLAMITSQSYQDVRAEFTQQYIDKGMTEWAMNGYLAEHGYAVAHKYPHYMPQQKHRDVWPPVPFAPIHYCCVYTASNTHHYVVMLADGSIIDPAKSGVWRCADYEAVQNVAGVIKMPVDIWRTIHD